ncbi:putative N-acetyltransferase YafP [Ralstonia mannitolilytica]|uniref:GNAT family N-acetyltransferase n=1 Tax=Ralstonia mannitolilytica TaxID=105219 RepID=UPI0007B00858|nr:GNAT family N-acetyltransferase [Ralstonia mannitolilytica]ANA35045.1 acetyltransferase [Ralstonia mannitolilytica]CAJ0689180.1 putative N-acetyltransferase YafP [Ralstonia mannitolilytica]CAJ0870216.1 putative N-acetyltransferase YafP [Ralstonia mannitolilytica]
MLIRAFHSSDAPGLRVVFHSAVHGLAASHYRPDQLDAWAPASYDAADWAQRMCRIQPFVVEIDGHPVAYADLQPDGLIDHFFVAASHARQGIGQQLMRHIVSLAGQRGLAHLHAYVSLAAEPFFARNGFAIRQRQTVAVRGVALDNAWMARVVRGDPGSAIKE